jgi:hypothetical protein
MRRHDLFNDALDRRYDILIEWQMRIGKSSPEYFLCAERFERSVLFPLADNWIASRAPIGKYEQVRSMTLAGKAYKRAPAAEFYIIGMRSDGKYRFGFFFHADSFTNINIASSGASGLLPILRRVKELLAGLET